MKKLAICMTLLALGTITFVGCGGDSTPTDTGIDTPAATDDTEMDDTDTDDAAAEDDGEEETDAGSKTANEE